MARVGISSLHLDQLSLMV